MGNLFARDELSFDFKGGNIKTEDISSTIPYMRKLDTQAKQLVGQLDTKINYNNKSLVLFNESDNFDMYKLFEKSVQTNNNNNNFSETSPFISSDVYNQLLDNLKNKQSGGGKKRSSKKNKKYNQKSESYTPTVEDVDESSTSSDSSDSDDDIFVSDSNKSSKKPKTLEKVMKKHSESETDHNIDIEPDKDDEFSPMSHGISSMSASNSIGSYISSSAHSDGVSSEQSSNNSLTMNSTVSAKHYRNRQNYSDSVNTSDINIISVDE
jgi:hypothetical protein